MKDKYFIPIVLILAFAILGVIFYKCYIKTTSENDNVYIYDVDNVESQNIDLLKYFVENTKNNLKCSLKMEYQGDYDEVIEYAIQNNVGSFDLYTLIDENTAIDKTTYSNLNEVSYNNHTYYFLSNEETLDDDFIKNYFSNGDGQFEVFELGILDE